MAISRLFRPSIDIAHRDRVPLPHPAPLVVPRPVLLRVVHLVARRPDLEISHLIRVNLNKLDIKIQGPVLQINYHGYHGRGTKGIWGDQRVLLRYTVFLKERANRVIYYVSKTLID